MCRPAKKSSCIGSLMPTPISLEMQSGVLFQMDSSLHWSKQSSGFQICSEGLELDAVQRLET